MRFGRKTASIPDMSLMASSPACNQWCHASLRRQRSCLFAVADTNLLAVANLHSRNSPSGDAGAAAVSLRLGEIGQYSDQIGEYRQDHHAEHDQPDERP